MRSSLDTAMFRSLLLIPLLFAASLVPAQGTFTIHAFECWTPMEADAQKWITKAITDLDPTGKVSIDGQRVKIGLPSAIAPDLVLDALNTAGVGSFRSAFSAAKSLSGNASGMLPFPIYRDTGDPASDAATYNAAKAAWHVEHPADDPSKNVHR